MCHTDYYDQYTHDAAFLLGINIAVFLYTEMFQYEQEFQENSDLRWNGHSVVVGLAHRINLKFLWITDLVLYSYEEPKF